MARTAFTLPATWAEEPAKSTSNERRLRVEAQPNRDPAQVIGYAIVVQPVLGAEVAGRHGAQLRAHQALGVIEQLLDQRVQLRFAVLLHQLEHALLADAAGAHLRFQVAFTLLCGAHVQQDQVPASRGRFGRRAQSVPEECECLPERSRSPGPSSLQTFLPRPHGGRGWKHKSS
jgi:hypothetical protein